MARPVPSDVSPALAAFLRELVSTAEAGSRIGVSWRLREARYPDTRESPVCLLLQVATETGWTTVVAFDPTGLNVNAPPPGSVEIATYTTATRPAPGPSASAIIRVKDPGQPGQFQGCMQQSGGTWEWVIIALASQ